MARLVAKLLVMALAIIIAAQIVVADPPGDPKYKPAKDSRDKVPDEFIVTLVEGADIDSVVDELTRGKGAEKKGQWNILNFRGFGAKVPPGRADTILAEWEADPRVASIEDNQFVTLVQRSKTRPPPPRASPPPPRASPPPPQPPTPPPPSPPPPRSPSPPPPSPPPTSPPSPPPPSPPPVSPPSPPPPSPPLASPPSPPPPSPPPELSPSPPPPSPSPSPPPPSPSPPPPSNLRVQSGATWGLSRVDQLTVPVDGFYGYSSDGTGVYAYIIDTGIAANHPDHTDAFGVTRVVPGANALTSPISFADTSDGHGHGTHVAGTVGGKTWGVAKNVKLVPVKVFDSAGGGATTTVIVNAINWAVADTRVPNGKKVLNLSLGGSAQTAMDSAVNQAVVAGVTVVVAAGNENVDACTRSPARAASGLTVAASTSSDARASFSNWGTCVDIFAPGQSITSTSNTLGTQILSGTSMATPHVAGMVARLLQTTCSTPTCVYDTMINGALQGRVIDPMGSPNRLLFRDRSL